MALATGSYGEKQGPTLFTNPLPFPGDVSSGEDHAKAHDGSCLKKMLLQL
jgi:hypothetical protein